MDFESKNNNNNNNNKNKNTGNIKTLKIVLIITSTFLIVEVIAGIFTNSLALISDAGHMFTDAAGIGISLFAITFASKKALTPQRTYGFYRLEILAALINSIIILLLSFYIIYEAYIRLFETKEIQGVPLLVVAIIGLIVNLVGMKLLHGHAKDNLNMEGAYLEVLKDALGSIAVIVSGIIIIFTEYYIVDPVISIGLAIFIWPRTWSLLKRSIHILMEGVPPNISYEQIKKSILEIKGVTGIFDLHIWKITSGFDALTAHVVIHDVSKSQAILREIQSLLEKKFNIAHTTIQIETYHK
ncbi:MAG TPA: cation diffusion facilitator family transporter [Nitrososphaeraceae archaeon]|nr:cation diffusion facilitator family transporter [Nitrososphaeraceae archaeon]